MYKRAICIILAVIVCVSLLPIKASAALTAVPTASAVLVDGEVTAFDAYNINGNNYFKLRDLAYAINGSPKQFEVAWDGARNAITLTSGRPYTPVGGEMTSKGLGAKTPVPTSSAIYLDGKEVSFTAYNIEGNNYFKLRDVGQAFNFGVTWDGANNRIIIDTSERYVDDSAAAGKIDFDESKVLSSLDVAPLYGLSRAEKELYDLMCAAIMNFEMVIDVDMKIETDAEKDSIIKVADVIYVTLPDFYLFTSKLGFNRYSDGTYCLFPIYSIDGKELRARMQDGKVVYPPDSEISEAKLLIARRKEAVMDALADLPVDSGMTQFEIEVAVHDWLCSKVGYNKIADEAPERKTIYGALVGGQGDCVGFSRSFKYILGLLGVESAIMIGSNEGAYHAWNVVRLDGNWYHIDSSTNSLQSRLLGVSTYHYYFNRTDEFIKQAFSILDVSSNPKVVCTSLNYDYYRKTGARIASDADLNRIPALIAKARANGAKMIELEYDPAYAQPLAIVDKLKQIDAEGCEGIEFLYNSMLMYGVF